MLLFIITSVVQIPLASFCCSWRCLASEILIILNVLHKRNSFRKECSAVFKSSLSVLMAILINGMILNFVGIMARRDVGLFGNFNQLLVGVKGTDQLETPKMYFYGAFVEKINCLQLITFQSPAKWWNRELRIKRLQSHRIVIDNWLLMLKIAEKCWELVCLGLAATKLSQSVS